jgi:hypothetical protein
VVRGVPAVLVYRNTLSLRERFEAVLLTATALPLLVALAEIGLDSGVMLEENAAALVGAGVLSVAVFPLLAITMRKRRVAATAATAATAAPAGTAATAATQPAGQVADSGQPITVIE